MAKVKVAQNRHVCDQSEKKLQAMFYTYPIKLLENRKIAVNSLCDLSNPKRGLS